MTVDLAKGEENRSCCAKGDPYAAHRLQHRKHNVIRWRQATHVL